MLVSVGMAAATSSSLVATAVVVVVKPATRAVDSATCHATVHKDRSVTTVRHERSQATRDDEMLINIKVARSATSAVIAPRSLPTSVYAIAASSPVTFSPRAPTKGVLVTHLVNNRMSNSNGPSLIELGDGSTLIT